MMAWMERVPVKGFNFGIGFLVMSADFRKRKDRLKCWQPFSESSFSRFLLAKSKKLSAFVIVARLHFTALVMDDFTTADSPSEGFFP